MISFIMPAKNAAKYISEAIAATAIPRSEEWELIVVEDHSEDDTFAIVSDWSEKDSRIRVLRNPGRGKIAGLNHGYALANGDRIKCIDADDILHQDYFKNESMNNCDAMCHDAYITSPDLTKLCNYTVNRRILSGSFDECLRFLVSLPRWTWSFNRKIANKIFPMPEEIPFEDVWFSLMVKRYANRINYVPKRLYYYRQHERQTYAGILNFAEEAVIFRANRVQKFIEVLDRYRGRLSLDKEVEDSFLDTPREYYSLLGRKPIGIGDILASSIPLSMKGRVLVSRKLNSLAPWILKMKWIFQK